MLRATRQPAPSGRCPAAAHPSQYFCQWLATLYCGTKLADIALQPFNAAVLTLPAYGLIADTAIGGWGSWNGLRMKPTPNFGSTASARLMSQYLPRRR